MDGHDFGECSDFSAPSSAARDRVAKICTPLLACDASEILRILPADHPREHEVSSSATTPPAATSAETDVYEAVVQALVEECEVPREQITPESNLAEEFGLDSLAFVDLCYALDMRLNIKIPFEQWINDVNSGTVDAKDAFLMKNIVSQVEELVRARPA
jgi:acyl carrier protein